MACWLPTTASSGPSPLLPTNVFRCCTRSCGGSKARILKWCRSRGRKVHARQEQVSPFKCATSILDPRPERHDLVKPIHRLSGRPRDAAQKKHAKERVVERPG